MVNYSRYDRLKVFTFFVKYLKSQFLPGTEAKQSLHRKPIEGEGVAPDPHQGMRENDQFQGGVTIHHCLGQGMIVTRMNREHLPLLDTENLLYTQVMMVKGQLHEAINMIHEKEKLQWLHPPMKDGKTGQESQVKYGKEGGHVMSPVSKDRGKGQDIQVWDGLASLH